MERLLISWLEIGKGCENELLGAIEAVRNGNSALFPALTAPEISLLQPSWVGDEYQLYCNDLAEFEDICLPPGYVLSKLEPKDIPLISSHQTVQYPPNYLSLLFKRLPDLQYGIKHGDELVSWACTHSDLSTGLISTLPQHQRKGLAKICVLKVISKQQELIQSSFAFVKYDNEKSRWLLLSCRFQKSPGEYFWCSK